MWDDSDEPNATRDVVWIGSSLRDLRCFPDPVRQSMGFALFQAQRGGRHVNATPLKGFKGSGVVEVVADFDGNAFRTVYSIRFTEAVYVLHAFQKKSTKGSRTPQREMNVVRSRLAIAECLHQAAMAGGKGER